MPHFRSAVALDVMLLLSLFQWHTTHTTQYHIRTCTDRQQPPHLILARAATTIDGFLSHHKEIEGITITYIFTSRSLCWEIGFSEVARYYPSQWKTGLSNQPWQQNWNSNRPRKLVFVAKPQWTACGRCQRAHWEKHDAQAWNGRIWIQFEMWGNFRLLHDQWPPQC